MPTWEVKITVLDIPTRTVSVEATRTDGTDVRTFNVLSAVIATAAQKQAVIDNIWSQFQASVQRDEQIAEIVGNLEAAAKAALEAREG